MMVRFGFFVQPSQGQVLRVHASGVHGPCSRHSIGRCDMSSLRVRGYCVVVLSTRVVALSTRVVFLSTRVSRFVVLHASVDLGSWPSLFREGLASLTPSFFSFSALLS